MHPLARLRIRTPRFLLLYPPLQFASYETAKPDGSLSLTYVAGALRRAGYEIAILDCAVGPDGTSLEESFFNVASTANGLRRVGMSAASILEAAADYDVIGISSIFTPQTAACLQLVAELRAAFPDKVILAGGVNARSMAARFYAAGVDLIALSEAEETIVSIARALQGQGEITAIAGVAFRAEDGREHRNGPSRVIRDLDELPLPAWDLLPLGQYWKISRPHGGNFTPGQTVRYASLQTSRGCPFRCDYCHISREQEGSPYGHIGAFRVKSVGRVLREFEILKGLGVEHIFIEDDSLFAKKRRAIEIFRLVPGMGLKLLDVNGINLIHMHAGHADGVRIDTELIGVLAEAGFTSLTLPFESASQRIIDKYASSKWNVGRTDTASLIRAFNDAGIRVSGNYMIGYPDETAQEIAQTIAMARQHVEQGLDYALFFTVVPFPGSALFDIAVREGYISADFDPDEMRWTKSIMRNLAMDAEALEQLRQQAWLDVNRPEYVRYKQGMLMTDRPLAEAQGA